MIFSYYFHLSLLLYIYIDLLFQDGVLMETKEVHNGRVFCLKHLRGQILSGSWDKTIKFFDMDTKEVVRTITGLHKSAVSCLSIVKTDKTTEIWSGLYYNKKYNV